MRHLIGLLIFAFVMALVAFEVTSRDRGADPLGMVKTWATQLGMADAAKLLDETLQEERAADMMLSQIAECAANRDAKASKAKAA